MEQTFRLSVEAEQALVGDPVAHRVWEALRLEFDAAEICARCGLDPAAWLRCLGRLEAMGLVEVHPGDRIRLVHRGIHSWQRQGPLAEHYRDRQHASLRAPLRGEVVAVVQSATRVVGPSFWDEAELELLTLAHRWRDRAWRDQTQLPRAQHRRVSWTLVLGEAPDFPEL